MTLYNVHIYREMRLRFDGIEAESPDAAADEARGRPLSEADDFDECDGEDFAALVDVAGDEDFTRSVTVEFEGERSRKAVRMLLSACRMVVDRWERGDVAEAARACAEAVSEAAPVTSPPEPAPSLVEALEYVRAVLHLRHIDEAGDEDVAEALSMADQALAGPRA